MQRWQQACGLLACRAALSKSTPSLLWLGIVEQVGDGGGDGAGGVGAGVGAGGVGTGVGAGGVGTGVGAGVGGTGVGAGVGRGVGAGGVFLPSVANSMHRISSPAGLCNRKVVVVYATSFGITGSIHSTKSMSRLPMATGQSMPLHVRCI